MPNMGFLAIPRSVRGEEQDQVGGGKLVEQRSSERAQRGVDAISSAGRRLS